MEMESKFGAHNYHPLPIVFSKAKGCSVWDPEGKHYFDFLSAYSATNQGHCHDKIIGTLKEQAERCTLTSRAFYNDLLPQFSEQITKMFGYDKVLPMNTGAEAVDSAMKLARKWAYEVKGVKKDQAKIISAEDCFHGRTFGAIALSTDPESYNNYGPQLPNIEKVPYNNIEALEKKFIQDSENIAAFILEPIQGEAGVVVPDEGYLSKVAALCSKYNVLFIADEIQTGLCRSGKMLCIDYENIRPDIIILGKALSGGVLPVSAILADDEIMLTIKPGQHGSTYGGNPLSCAVAMTSLDVLQDEGLAQNAFEKGKDFRNFLRELNIPYIKDVRGKGLLNAIEVDPNLETSAWDICMNLKNSGLLAKPTHDNIIRFAPPLVITQNEMDQCKSILSKVLKDPLYVNPYENQSSRVQYN